MTLPKKWEKILKDMPEFVADADAASTEELNKIIVNSEGNIYTIENEKSNDEKLNAAKELVKEYSASYRDAMKYQMAKIKYALHRLESSGVEISDEEPSED